MAFEQDEAARIAALEARLSRLEALLERWVTIETSSMMNADKWQQEGEVRQELRRSPEIQARYMQAIRAAWQSGDRKQAIQLYSDFYDVDAKTAQAALEHM